MSFQQKLEAEKSRQRAERAQQELVEAEATELTRQPVAEPEVLQEDIIKPINYSALKAKKRPRIGKLNDDEAFVPDDLSLAPILKKAKTSRSPSKDADEVESPSGFAPAKKAWTKGTVEYSTREIIENRKNPSDWYADTNTNQKVDRGNLQLISYTKDIIKDCLDAIWISRKSDAEINTHFDKLRTKLHEMEFYEFPKLDVLIKKSKILENDGLKKIYGGIESRPIPWDIKADAESLYNRWMSGDRDPSLLRGLETTKSTTEEGKKRTTHKLDPKYAQRKLADVVGFNGLSNGQWWPNRLCAIRDGAHGEQEAGIYGKKDQGAFAVVVAAGGYADLDNGETILYCGTESETSKPTHGTTYLDFSFRRKQPIRVLRAVNKKSKYAPKEGIRYDGMYKIMNKELLSADTAMYRFTLRRLSNQDPIRYQGVEMRPTQQELEQLKEVRELLA